jgi:hypothetical protein
MEIRPNFEEKMLSKKVFSRNGDSLNLCLHLDGVALFDLHVFQRFHELDRF